MRVLLDTHVLLWWLEDSPSLPARARELISDSQNQVFVSAISLWEIAIKSSLGKVRAEVRSVSDEARRTGFHALPFGQEHAVAVAQLPDIHRDPFDRALIAQALCEPLHLLTHDAALAAYGEHVLPV